MRRRQYKHPSFIAALLSIILITCKAFSPPTKTKLHLTKHTATTMKNRPDDKMLSTYQSLATRLIDRHKNAKHSELKNNQLFICIAGGPGSGKSTLASAVASLINSQLHDNAAVVLPMDGFHYTRAQLKSMGDDPSYPHSYEELIARRGAPWTFDAEGCVKAFIEARERGEANLPIYSRKASDPVPNGVQLCKETQIVLLEGNYLLAWDDERWSPLKAVFDETWFVCCKSLEDQRERLVKRHLETWSEEKTRMWGEGEVGAGKKADANDMMNAEWIERMSRRFCDLVVESM